MNPTTPSSTAAPAAIATQAATGTRFDGLFSFSPMGVPFPATEIADDGRIRGGLAGLLTGQGQDANRGTYQGGKAQSGQRVIFFCMGATACL